MTSYQPGEIVTVTIPNAKVSDRHVQDSHLWLTVRDEPIYIPLRVLGSVKVERVWPAGSGAPQVGDVWIGRSGTRYGAIRDEDREGDEPMLMAFVAGGPLWTPTQIAAHDGPLTLAWREGWTAGDVDQADEPELDERAALIAGVREYADFLEAHPGLPVDPYAVGATRYVRNHVADETEAFAELRRIGEILGVEPDLRDGPGHSHPRVEKRFTGGVRYEAVYVTDAYKRGYEPVAAAPETDPVALDDLAIAATDPADWEAGLRAGEPDADGDFIAAKNAEPHDAATVDHSECHPAGQDVKCDRCGREYVCTPFDDFYCATEGDHCCEACLVGGAPIAHIDLESPLDEPVFRAPTGGPRDEPGSGLAT